MTEPAATPALKPVEQNSWYLLATLYGEPIEWDVELQVKNRVAWNRYYASQWTDKQRAALQGRVDAAELVPFSDAELADIRRQFRERAGDVQIDMPDAGASIDFRKCNFPLYISFSKYVFGNTSFGGATLVSTSFHNASFSGGTNFSGAQFYEGTDFTGATFSEQARFESASFFGLADFSGATFSEQANFESTSFFDIADFSSATFSNYAFFGVSTFYGGLTFSNSTFWCAGFYSVRFSETASFSSATFTGSASFGGATFTGDADFSSATFSGNAVFSSATFSRDATFVTARFSRDADFRSATFTGHAYFGSVTFTRDAYFSSATFRKEARFTNSELKAPTSFERSRFLGEPPRFHGAKLHEDTVWRRVEWPTAPTDPDKAGRFTDAYERLKQEMDRLKKHEDELMFFAMELACRRVARGQVRGLPIGAYGVLCHYGQSYMLPLGWLIAMILVGAVQFWPVLNWDFLLALGVSTANTLGPLGLRKELMDAGTLPPDLSRWLRFLSGAQMVIGLILLFLIGLGLRNRFRMK